MFLIPYNVEVYLVFYRSSPVGLHVIIFLHVLKCFLPGTLQATRALMVVGILLGLIAIFVATVGMKCMKCLEDNEVQKMRMAVIGGVIFLIAGKRGPIPLPKVPLAWFHLPNI